MELNELNEKSKKILLEIAKRSIGSKFEEGTIEFEDIPAELKDRRGVFVTLTINGKLRGCIGNIEPIDEIYKAVSRNAINAAFSDPRFPPLRKDELSDTSIEISILTLPEEFPFDTPQDLLDMCELEKPGLVIESGMNRATFLPQVWDEMDSAEEFLTNLCQKAGLPPFYWKDSETYRDLKVAKYSVISIADEKGKILPKT